MIISYGLLKMQRLIIPVSVILENLDLHPAFALNSKGGDCFFKHECADCGSKDHGADDCRKKKNKISEKGPRARIPFIPSNNSE